MVPLSLAGRFETIRLQQYSLPVLYFVFSLIIGSWTSRIPALRDHLQASHSSLSMVLLCTGLGAVISYPLSSRLMTRYGGRRTLFYAGIALITLLLAIGMAPSLPHLMLAVLLLGVSIGTFDVALNSIATTWERSTGVSQMSKLHAWGCLGGLSGVSIGSCMAMLNIAPARHYALLAIPLSLVLWLGYEWLEGGRHREAMRGSSFALPRGPLALLGALGFLGAMSEGGIAGWSGIFLKDHFSVTDGFAPLAMSAFTVMMLLARLTGDRLKQRHGAARLLSAGAALSAAGLAFTVLAPGPAYALAGFAASGLGLAVMFPFIFSAAGKEGPVALAGVATMAYSGSLMGPPVIGTLGHLLGMEVAMGFIALLSMLIAIVASRSALLK